MRPRRTMVTVSKPRWGCCGKPGTTEPWYMRHPSFPAKSCPRLRPASDAAGPSRSLPAGYASSWWTQKRNGSAHSQGKPSGRVSRMGLFMGG